MDTEYKLSYTASQIDERLSMVDNMVKSVNGQTPDENGNVNVEGGSGGGGADGFSPVAKVTQTDSGATITITDKNGTTTATVTNGKDGKDGVNGKDGADGKTPVKGVDYFDGKDGQNGSPGKDGADGKSAYAYAQDGGYAGTEEEFAEKLADDTHAVTDWNASEGEVGHVLNRTHYTYTATLIPKAELQLGDDGAFAVETDEVFEAGKTYTIYWNGAVYNCTAVSITAEGDTVVVFGNMAAVGGEDTGEPFCTVYMPGMLGIIPMDETVTTVTIRIDAEKIKKIPIKYYDACYLVEVNKEGDVYSTNITAGELSDALLSGLPVYARISDRDVEDGVVVEYRLNLIQFKTYMLGSQLLALVPMFTGYDLFGVKTKKLIIDIPDNIDPDTWRDSALTVEYV